MSCGGGRAVSPIGRGTGKAPPASQAPATLQARTHWYAPATFQARTTAVLGWAMGATGEGRGAGASPAGSSVRRERRPSSALRPLPARPGPGAFWMTQSAGCRSATCGPARGAIWSTGATAITTGMRLDAYSHLLRDRRNGEVEPIFYGVLDQLFFLWKALGRPARIDLVSGYRSAGDECVAPRHRRGRRPQLAAHDRYGGGHQGARPRDRGGVAPGRRSAAGRRRPLPGLRLRPSRRGPGAKLGLSGTSTASSAGLTNGGASGLSVPIISAVMAARS